MTNEQEYPVRCPIRGEAVDMAKHCEGCACHLYIPAGKQLFSGLEVLGMGVDPAKELIIPAAYECLHPEGGR